MSNRAVAGWPNTNRPWWGHRVKPLNARESVARVTFGASFPAWLAAMAMALLIVITLAMLLMPKAQISTSDLPQPSGQPQLPPERPNSMCDLAAVCE